MNQFDIQLSYFRATKDSDKIQDFLHAAARCPAAGAVEPGLFSKLLTHFLRSFSSDAISPNLTLSFASASENERFSDLMFSVSYVLRISFAFGELEVLIAYYSVALALLRLSLRRCCDVLFKD